MTLRGFERAPAFVTALAHEYMRRSPEGDGLATVAYTSAQGFWSLALDYADGERRFFVLGES